MKYSNNVQNIYFLEAGSTSREATFHLRFQLLKELFMVNASLISYRTVLSSFSPTLPKVPPQTLKFLLFLPSGDTIGIRTWVLETMDYYLPVNNQLLLVFWLCKLMLSKYEIQTLFYIPINSYHE